MNYFYIPEIGDKIRLTEDWTFALYNERRNDSLMHMMLVKDACGRYRQKYPYNNCEIVECRYELKITNVLPILPIGKE